MKQETNTPEASTAKRGGPPRLLSYVIVAAVSLGLGAGAVLLWHRGHDEMVMESAGAEVGMAGMEMPAPQPGAGEGAEKGVYISPARQQLVGVRTAAIAPHELATTIRATGTLAYDERRIAMVHTKVPGWVEGVFVDYVGKAVRKNEPLFTVYSPELVATQSEYLLALKNRTQLEGSSVLATRAAADALLAAARDRLRLWDIPEEHIAHLERSGEIQKTLMLHSPFDGVVLERSAYPGMYLTPDMPAFKIADLSRIWVFGSLYEYELPLVKLGQEAEIEFPYGQATRSLKGRITFIYPEIDPQTRRIRVRAEFDNPGLEFKPETYVTVVIRTGGGRQLAIPKEAVIDTGAMQYAILARAGGYFEPREIEVGQPGDDFYPLLGGLAEGDRIVTSAQFLVDSETNLQAAMQAMMNMPGMDMSMPGMDMPPGDTMEGMEMPTPQDSGHEGRPK